MSGDQSLLSAYSGSVWIDGKCGELRPRLTHPEDFPLLSIERASRT